MPNESTRRACLLGLAALIPAPATAAVTTTATRRQPRPAQAQAPRQAPRNRAPVRNAKKQAAATARAAPPTQQRQQRQVEGQSPRDRTPAVGDARRLASNRGAAPSPPSPAQPWPQIDGPPPLSRRPGLESAPVPNSNILPPIAERRQVGPNVSFGVPTPPQIIEGQSFRANDAQPQERQQQQQGGLRLPAPGATVRLPF
jgi:hypothetical protein